jgi:flagellar protein FliL
MAAEPALKKEAQSSAAAQVRPIKPRKKSPLPWLILLLLVIGGGGAGAWFAMRPAASASTAATGDAPAPAPTHATPIYYKFDPPFVVNFGGEGSTRYLQVTLEAMSRDAGVLDVLKNNEPAVRNDLVLLFSSQDSAALLSAEGKEKLRAATLETIRKVLDSEGADGKSVEAVYFTSFVIQ